MRDPYPSIGEKAVGHVMFVKPLIFNPVLPSKLVTSYPSIGEKVLACVMFVNTLIF